MARCVVNPFRVPQPDWSAPELAFVEAIGRGDQRAFHRQLPGYAVSPLRDLSALAAELGLGGLLVKDEADRFGIQAFKGLGASFAIDAVLRGLGSGRPEPITVTAATDGNHGRAVAWTANRLGQRAVIFMPADTAAARIASIEKEGAEVRLVPGTFDDCVTACADTAAREGWQVIADTAYPGYMEVPGYIMTGYSTIFAELVEQLDRPLDAVFLPAGVGGLAAAGVVSLVQHFGPDRPRLVCVEPDDSACFLESILAGDGAPHPATGAQRSMMVGLCCGLPSLLAWPVIRDAMDVFLSIEDDHVIDAMRAYHRHGVTAGESGASSLAGLMAVLTRKDLAPARLQLGLGPSSQVLVINTEGATDPMNHARIVGKETP